MKDASNLLPKRQRSVSEASATKRDFSMKSEKRQFVEDHDASVRPSRCLDGAQIIDFCSLIRWLFWRGHPAHFDESFPQWRDPDSGLVAVVGLNDLHFAEPREHRPFPPNKTERIEQANNDGTLIRCYQHSDEATLLRVMSESRKVTEKAVNG